MYAIPFIGYYLQITLKSTLQTVLYTKGFQWFKFTSSYRAGLEMRLKLPEENEFYLETHDSDVTTLFCKHIRPGFVVVDIGAHIGYFTLLISRLVGPEGKVFALEPLPRNFRRLEEHLFRNHCSQNTKVFQVAIADYDGNEQFLYFDFATIGRFSSAESEVKDKPSGDITVECRSLDSLLQDGSIELPDFVKIDVEGAEVRVLQGMDNIFGISRPELLIEIHSERAAQETLRFLQGKDYYAYINDRPVDRLSFSPLEIAINVLFVPREKVPR